MDARLCYYDITPHCERRLMIDNEVIADFGTGTTAKVWKRIYYAPIIKYARREKIEFVYIRSAHNANPFTLRLVKHLKSIGAKVVMEIPTYPYDQEYITRSMKLSLHLIGVAEVHYWHGFDRLVNGLAEYYRTNPDYKVYFHIVGPLTGEREQGEILPVIRDNHLEPYVILHGPLHSEELDAQFEKADFAIGSLGRHRSGIAHIKTLKNREYAARGLAFTYSENDDDFDSAPYVWKAPADESPVDIMGLVEFQRALTMTPLEIRESVYPLSWKAQMQKVIKEAGFGSLE